METGKRNRIGMRKHAPLLTHFWCLSETGTQMSSIIRHGLNIKTD